MDQKAAGSAPADHPTLLRIEAPHFVAGIELGGRSAPILRFMTGWSEARILLYARAREWRVELVAASRPADRSAAGRRARGPSGAADRG